jgi:7-cyano-7-deazaguanine synthase
MTETLVNVTDTEGKVLGSWTTSEDGTHAPVDVVQEPEGVSDQEGNDPKAICVVSGGMDSVAALYHTYDNLTRNIIVISFDYGQRHQKELGFAAMHAETLGLPWVAVGMQFLGQLFADFGSKSSLVNDDIDVPEGHYAEESMKATVVPNRNMIMASIAAGVAVAAQAKWLVLGVHSGDHHVYPDCRPQFFHQLEQAISQGNEGFLANGFEVKTPWMYRSKADIVRTMDNYGLHSRASLLQMTWSCYVGGQLHCGRCGTCVERKEAFEQAGVQDPTVYESAAPAVTA